MFCIVYLIEFGKYIIVPHTWIYGADKTLEEIVFSGLKQKKKYLCYSSNLVDAMLCENGAQIPNEKFLPNFLIARGNEYPVQEGTFMCQIKALRGKSKAVQSTQRQFLFRFYIFYMIHMCIR